MTRSVPASEFRRIAALASATPVHRAFHWLHLHQPQVRQWLLEIVSIPAPTFFERARAEAVCRIFNTLGFAEAHLDHAGNVLALLPAAADSVTIGSESPVLLISAHLDTVFPAGTDCVPRQDGSRIFAPGACDNGAGLSALLALAAALRYAVITPPVPILFAANVGEEGEGNLFGMRHLFTKGSFAGRIGAAIVLDGAGDSAVVTRALGSLRFKLTVTGPGGHSWADAGTPNPIFLLAKILATLAELPLPSDPRTTLNVGCISGGTSVNSIPSSASAQMDLRSTDPEVLQRTAELLRESAAGSLARENQANDRFSAASLLIEVIGERPAASLAANAPLLLSLMAADRHLGLFTEHRVGSTDANLPLSLGIPAVAVGAGGTGGGFHTLSEWYDPTSREIALRRILLALLDAADQLLTK